MCFRTGRYSVLRPSLESWYTAVEGQRDDVGAKSLVRAPLSPVRGDNYHNDRPVNVNNVPFSYRPPAVDWTHHIIIIIFFFSLQISTWTQMKSYHYWSDAQCYPPRPCPRETDLISNDRSKVRLYWGDRRLIVFVISFCISIHVLTIFNLPTDSFFVSRPFFGHTYVF